MTDRERELARRIVWLDANRRALAMGAAVLALAVVVVVAGDSHEGGEGLAFPACGMWLVTQIVCLALISWWRAAARRLALARAPSATLVRRPKK